MYLESKKERTNVTHADSVTLRSQLARVPVGQATTHVTDTSTLSSSSSSATLVTCVSVSVFKFSAFVYCFYVPFLLFF